MLRARALQDDSGGFQAFIPLAFHPDNNQMRKLPAPSATDTLRVHAVSRLVLDNIPHVKGFWIATGVEIAQLALWFGVDDLDGTVQEEKIYHMAGARTPEAMTTGAIRRLIRAAGREPVERDTLYNVVTGPEAPDEAAALVQIRISLGRTDLEPASGKRAAGSGKLEADHGHQAPHRRREGEHRRASAAPGAIPPSLRRRDGCADR